jgi:outer membrane murein-binding lipoprotein Lpp
MKRSIQLGVLVAAVAGMTMLTSCSSKITEEQLATLRDLRQQEQTLNQQIRQKEGERDRLQGEVNARRAELDRCNTNKQFVQGKLAQWPNVWPDWQPAPVNTPTPAKKTR